MKLLFLLCANILFGMICIQAELPDPGIKGQAAILINADTGVILFEKNAHDLHYPASTTKVATALYVLKHHSHKLDTNVIATGEALATIDHEAKRRSDYTLPAYYLEPDGSHIGMKKDEEMMLKDLLKGMLISSGNDAANVIAHTLEGTIPQFMDKLNILLKEIGCKNTTYYNPHGLHHPQHRTTAYDLSVMARESLKNPIFCEIVSQTRFNRPKTNKQKALTLIQTNRLLRPGKFYYPKAIGMKTGYHSKAKKTFIGAARSHDRTLILVLLKYEERNQLYQDAIALFDAAFNQPKIHHVFLTAGKKKFIRTLLHARTPLETYLAEDISIDYYPAENPKAKCMLYWHPLSLPIHKGQEVAELQLIAENGSLLQKKTLFAQEEVKLEWPYNWYRTFTLAYGSFSTLFWLSGAFLLCLIVFVGFKVLRVRR